MMKFVDLPIEVQEYIMKLKVHLEAVDLIRLIKSYYTSRGISDVPWYAEYCRYDDEPGWLDLETRIRRMSGQPKLSSRCYVPGFQGLSNIELATRVQRNVI